MGRAILVSVLIRAPWALRVRELCWAEGWFSLRVASIAWPQEYTTLAVSLCISVWERGRAGQKDAAAYVHTAPVACARASERPWRVCASLHSPERGPHPTGGRTPRPPARRAWPPGSPATRALLTVAVAANRAGTSTVEVAELGWLAVDEIEIELSIF